MVGNVTFLSTHADRQGVDSVFVCVYVRLRISPPRIKLVASNFARQFLGVQGRESPILVDFAAPEAQNRTSRPTRGPRHPHVNVTADMRRRKRHARDAPSVKSRDVWT